MATERCQLVNDFTHLSLPFFSTID